jgi:hypothetical protein
MLCHDDRCFFIHLGIALGVHPFALQTAFRRMAAAALDRAGKASGATR